MKKLLAVMLMGALVLGAVATPAWGAEKPNAGGVKAGKMRSIEGARHKARRHVIRGEITQVGDGSFVMKTRKGPVTVKFNKETQYKGGDSSNLKVGAKVGVVPRGCPRKPGVNADKARAGEHKAGPNAGAHKAGAHKGKPGLRAKFCMGVRKPQAKALVARAIVFPRARTGQ